MNPDDSRPVFARSDAHRHPELGLFERIHEWNDVFPWFRLARTLRMAGSPPLVLLTFLWLGLWWLGAWWILGESGRNHDRWIADQSALGAAARPIETVVRLAYTTSPSSLHGVLARPVAWRFLLGTAWSLLLWAPLALLLTRQGGLLTAGRPMISLGSGLQQAFSRMPRAWLTALVPAACVAMIAVLLFVFGKLCQWIEGIAAIDVVLAILLSMIAIASGLLAFGSHFAIPMSWAALANEQNPDPLDSLSRGYEYLLRRPLQLVAYLILSLIIVLVIWSLATGVASAGTSVSHVVLGNDAEGSSLTNRVATVLSWFPVAVAVTLAWGLVGGSYLLLRCDAGGQEVEDIWVPPLKPEPPLPSVPTI